MIIFRRKEEPKKETEKEQLMRKEENQESVVSLTFKLRKGQKGEGNEQPHQLLLYG